MDVYIKVEHLKKLYGDTVAVDDVSFSLHPGEIVAFLGPNGAGKTTTVEILLGIRKKTSGRLWYFGEEVERPMPIHLKRIGAVLQEESFLPNLTVRELLQMFGMLYGRGDVDGVIKAFALEEFQHKIYRRLSGGQKRRLSLAVSVVHKPDVVFLDEPTVGLDVGSRLSLHQYILSIKEEGRSVFLTTHYIEEAEKLADRVIIINHGRIIASGTVPQLIKQASLPTVVYVNGNRHEIPSEAHIRDVLSMYDDIYDINVKRPTLEDVFITLVGKDVSIDGKVSS